MEWLLILWVVTTGGLDHVTFKDKTSCEYVKQRIVDQLSVEFRQIGGKTMLPIVGTCVPNRVPLKEKDAFEEQLRAQSSLHKTMKLEPAPKEVE